MQRKYLIFNLALPYWKHYVFPFWEHCAFLFWYRYALPFLYHDALAELVSSLQCSIKGFPSYRGLIWFSSGLGGGAIFLKLKNGIISEHPPDILSTCSDHLIIFWVGWDSEIWCQVTANRSGADMFLSCGSIHLEKLSFFSKKIPCQLCVSISGTLCVCFSGALCASILGLLCASILQHYALAELVSSLKCSMGCSQATEV